MTDENRRTKPPTPVHYERETVRAAVVALAEERLAGEYTVETVEWEDGTFQITAYHTIPEVYPLRDELRGGLDGDDARPFYRERIRFDSGEVSGYIFQEVVQRYTGRNAYRRIYSDPVAWAPGEDPRKSPTDDPFGGEVQIPEQGYGLVEGELSGEAFEGRVSGFSIEGRGPEED